MATIEIGTWRTRAGCIGDVACTHSLRSLALRSSPDESDFMSMMLSGGQPDGVGSEEEEGAPQGETDLVPLWSLRSFQQNPDVHIRQLCHLKSTLLGCDSPDDPLMLVVPEVWHERLDVISGMFELILEDGAIANALYCIRPSVCWALANGKATAVVLDVGHSHTTVTGVLDGYALRHTVDSVAVGGAAVTAQFSQVAEPFVSSFLEQQFPMLDRDAARRQYMTEDYLSDVKRVYGFVSTGGAESGGVSLQPLKAPDGSTLVLSAEQRSSPFELYFGRNQGNDSVFDVAEMMARCKRRADPEWQVRSVHHVLAGAGARVKGFHERLLHEVKEKDAAYFRYERDNALTVTKSASGAWMGASLAAASSSFDPLWVSRAEWGEEGESVLYRKLFY